MTIQRSILFILLLLFIIFSGYGQMPDSASKVEKGDTNLALVVGYNFWNNHFAEIGLGISRLDKDGHHVGGGNMYLSTELKIDRDLIFGPKIGIWFGSISGGLGLSVICYSNQKETALRFRPELGL